MPILFLIGLIFSFILPIYQKPKYITLLCAPYVYLEDCVNGKCCQVKHKIKGSIENIMREKIISFCLTNPNWTFSTWYCFRLLQTWEKHSFSALNTEIIENYITPSYPLLYLNPMPVESRYSYHTTPNLTTPKKVQRICPRSIVI